MSLPRLPTSLDNFIPYISSSADVTEALVPFKAYEAKLREKYAQDSESTILKDHQINTVPIFAGHEASLKIRAREIDDESLDVRDKYLLPLSEDDRRPNGSPAIVTSMKEFKTNFSLFSESSLVDLDWSNVIAAGSSVVTALLPVSPQHNESKRALRAYYHEKLAPASDVDLFIYGLNQDQAIEKIKQIEGCIRDSILSETTTIRTKNTITIVSEYPTRHVQIVLRLYQSISEILTGFDVDCSCVAYDGKQVWAAPRAIAAFLTQVNSVDLTRRSPSYENRLSKYSHRGFEVFWPDLDRTRVDPTIFERSFSRVMGLARLLVLEKLPHPNDRDTYLAKRREERGRPPLPWNARYRHQLQGNVKDAQPDDVAEWVEEDDVSNYHTFMIPYGPKYNARRIEKLLFTKDLLLNAEWNRPKDRDTSLHRHPAFFGSIDDVIHDCCGFCPEARTDEDLAALEVEQKLYISGDVTFLKDNPGRQAIGSFNPITDDDWTEMAYIGNTARLCQAIVDCDLEGVQDWFSAPQADHATSMSINESDPSTKPVIELADVNRRDHTGRTPLHLAVMCSTPEIVQYLIDHGARIVARLVNGMTALHLAAHRGQTQMVKSLLEKSEANEEAEDRKNDARKEARRTARDSSSKTVDDHDSPSRVGGRTSGPEISDSDSLDEFASDEMGDDDQSDHITEGSFVKVEAAPNTDAVDDDSKDEPDVYDVDVLAWDSPVSPLHLGIMGGHVETIEVLIDVFGADVLLPVKLMTENRSPRAAILGIVLALQLPLSQANETIAMLLSKGASATQADMDHISALHFAVADGKAIILETLCAADGPAISKATNYVVLGGWALDVTVETPLLTAIKKDNLEVAEKLLSMGCEPEISFEAFAQAHHRKFGQGSMDPVQVKKIYQKSVNQPIIEAVIHEMPDLVERLLELGVDENTLPSGAWERKEYPDRLYSGTDKSLLDNVQTKVKELNDYLNLAKEQTSGSSTSLPQLREESSYLKGLQKGTYKYWIALNDLKQAQEVSRLQREEFEKIATNSVHREMRGENQKREAIQVMVQKYSKLEDTLLAKGAKSFYEIFPDIKRPSTDRSENNNTRFFNYGGNVSINKEPYGTDLSFMVPDLTPSKAERYCNLFEAAWTGDVEKAKQLTLASPEGLAPLQVAVQDKRGFSPFTIAVLRGHEELANILLGISTAQYQPDEKTSRYKYSMPQENNEGDINDADDDSDAIEVCGELVDENFSVDDIAALAGNVKSKISPMTLLTWDAEVWRIVSDERSLEDTQSSFMPFSRDFNVQVGEEKQQSWAWFNSVFEKESKRCRCSLIRYSIAENHMRILKHLLRIGGELANGRADEEASKVFEVSQSDFDLAVVLGRTEMIGEIIKSTGAAIPLHSLVAKSGVEANEKPKYYQGLSVHGKKRKDWADAGRGANRSPTESDHAPLLSVALKGNLETFEYFLGDAPLRRYKDFAERHKDDKRIQTLVHAEGGVDRALTTWLGARTNLAVHMAVMSKPSKDGANSLLDYIIHNMPESVDVKSTSGTTPLQLAFHLQRYYAAKALISAGANQASRDKNGANLLHTIISTLQNRDEDGPQMFSALALLDKSLVSSMTLQKCGGDNPGYLTPLAQYLRSHSCNEAVLAILLQCSGGKDLELMDGAGDFPLHELVRANQTKLARYIINYNPALLYRENATGMTPLDVVNTSYLRDRMDNPPYVRGDNRRYHRSLDSYDKSVVGKDPRYFAMTAEEMKKESDDKTTAKACWEMCNEMAALHPGKRQLVSLLDANEVAKRLARQQQIKNEENRRRESLGLNATGFRGGYRQRYGGRGEDDEGDKQDEVGQWMGMAQAFQRCDFETWMEQAKKEVGQADLKGLM